MFSIYPALTSGSSRTRLVLYVVEIWPKSHAPVQRSPLLMPSVTIVPFWLRVTEIFPITLSPSLLTTYTVTIVVVVPMETRRTLGE
ncbi:hypothetical protein LINGRAHAP2_LOCUS25144 [Linum grandiflorum]